LGLDVALDFRWLVGQRQVKDVAYGSVVKQLPWPKFSALVYRTSLGVLSSISAFVTVGVVVGGKPEKWQVPDAVTLRQWCSMKGRVCCAVH
jgi:hypothetical protein